MRVAQLTAAEQNRIDAIMRAEKGSATDALRRINEARRKANIRAVEKSTVHRYVKGLTHKRGAAEKHGRKRALSKKDIRRWNQPCAV